MVQDKETCDIFQFDEEKVGRLKPLVESEDLKTVSGMFKVLSDETRLKIIYCLSQEERLCVCDVAHIIGASTATASHHLRQLRKMGLAKSKKEGKLNFYSLDDEHVNTLITIGVIHAREVKDRDE
ncbi:cadmium-sensing regulator, CadC [Pelagirhabdus alkalitolerans]|uniref:Cadmium-sensing regulator, CadC n=1 Tax=Pelagirhabdus alkalitolerans TaxID=1612202 RepID=A0A1G6JVP7_9BACI|nr:metalloregulator ArsR/SmtB family transcription factor [Pelagirhabdus alkalitolerans]SDC22777.1 cadmium-sensing regulator, CadC [Pelagirhabdus alkalitolerans]